VIIIASSSPREARALALLIENRLRPTRTCASLGQLKTQLRKIPPAVVVTRTNLADGYSDDLLALLSKAELLPGTRVIVLARADCTPRQEARQLSLGADCVLKDPLRPEVLLEYIAKFLRTPQVPARRLPPAEQILLAGATILPDQQQMHYAGRAVHLTPREIELARLLAESPGRTITYHFLYSELFNRTFSGDTVNLRVLLGKLVSSYRKLGIDLRALIRVTPKSGYCYLPRSPGRAIKPLST
jgi:DNA-binding response OmpR family regulator